jgi:hypothetical protein
MISLEKFNKFLLSLFIFIFFFSIIFYLSNKFFPLDRHWSAIYDHELTLTYNALLFNSAELHEYIEHSGYFTILFLSIFFKILNFLNFLSIYKITAFNESNNLDIDLQNIIFFSRLYAIICSSFLFAIIFWFFEFISKNKFFSFLLTFLCFLSVGSFEHFIQLRTELLTMILFLLSFFSILIFLTEKKDFKSKYLFLFFIFLFCSILNKTQISFYLFAILLIANFIEIEKRKYFNLENYKLLEIKNFNYYMFSIVMLYLILKFFTKGSSILSIVFIFFNITMINIFFYLILKKNDLDVNKNLRIINFFFLMSYIIFKSILFIHPSTNEIAFNNTFTNIINNTFKYTSIAIEDNGNVFSIFLDFINQFKYIFGSINYYSFLIIISLLLNFTLLKNTKIIYFNLSCILSFFLISCINSLRPASIYYIFCDFFLILSFANYGKYSKRKIFLAIFPIIIIAGLLNYPNIKFKIENVPSNNTRGICGDTYFYDWHKKIPKDRFKKFCNKTL